MTLAFDHPRGRTSDFAIAVPIRRAGVLAQDICRRGGVAEVAAVFDRSLYLRAGEAFICIGEPAIGNGPLTLVVDGSLPRLRLQQGQAASIAEQRITIGDLLFGLDRCETWRLPAWPVAALPARLIETSAAIARRAVESPPGSLARAMFGADDTPLARIARPRIAHLLDRKLSRTMTVRALTTAVTGLLGLGPGLTPAGDDFLIGALTLLDAIGQERLRAALGDAIAEVAPALTSPLSACFLTAAANGHVGEHLHRMVASVITEDIDAAVAAAGRIGHTSGWDALTGVAATLPIVAEKL